MILFLPEKASTDEGREKRVALEYWTLIVCFLDPRVARCFTVLLTKQGYYIL